MKRCIWTALTILTVLMLLMAGAALAEGQSIADAVSISVNTTVNGSLSTSKDEKYYRFTLPSDGVVSVSFSHDYVDSGYTCWRLQLMNANQVEYLTREYIGNTVSEVTSCQIGLPAGQYYVKVKGGYNRYSTQTYHFSVNYEATALWEKEKNETIPTANTISVNTTYSGSVLEGSDIDFYKFSLPKAGFVTVSFSHDYVDAGSICWKLQLMNADQVEYLTQEYKGNTVSEVTSCQIGLPAGQYYVKVKDGYNRYSTQTYHFSVNYTEADNWETEFNNTIPAADPISINAEWNGTIRNWADDDFYVFTLNNNGYVTVSFTHAFKDTGNECWRLQLMNADQKEYLYQGYAGKVKSEITSPRIGLPAGTYYLKIQDGDYLSGAGSYQFSVNFKDSSDWETELNDKMSTADAVTPGRQYYGVTRNRSDTDFFEFNMKTKGRVFLRFTHENLHDGATKWKLSLLDSDSREYLKQLISGNATKTDTEFVDVPAGTYYVCVQPYSGTSTVPYSFVIGTSQVTVDDAKYTLGNGTATMTGPAKKNATKLTIPDSIKAYGKTWKVTEIEDGACKGLTKLQSVSIGKNVSTIGKKAFMNCTALARVTGGAGVTDIGVSAFQGCKKLAAYNLGSKTKTIGKSAFQNCTALKTVSGGTKLVTIGVSAFQKCAALTKMTLAATVKTVGKDAFNGCKNLKELVIKTKKLTESSIGANAFKGISAGAEVTCPKNKLDAYRKILLKRGMKKTVKFK